MNEDDRIGIIFLIAIIVWTLSCFMVVALGGCKLDPLWTFDEIPDLGLQNTQDVMSWVAQEIHYVSDDIHYPADEYWQSPAQTYVWRTGDCEDYAILALYLEHRDVGIDGRMILGEYNGGGHAWVWADGHFWEPQGGYKIDGNPSYAIWKSISYEDTIRRATTTHKALDRQE